MLNMLEKLTLKILRKVNPAYHSSKSSWSQLGEDMIIDFIFKNYLHCSSPSYLDIGANHPYILSNTYHFYSKGCRGVNLEPDPANAYLLKKDRPGDITLNWGVGDSEEELDFYIMSNPTLNTFSKETADEYTKSEGNGSATIMKVEKIKMVKVNTLLEKYFANTDNYFISIDVEGLDFDIVKSIDYGRYKPKVICVETLVYTSSRLIQKQHEIIDFILNEGYFVYADTTVNTIFVRNDIL